MIGDGRNARLEPGANARGLYESFDGGETFTMVWNGENPEPAPRRSGSPTSSSTRSTRHVVYASAFDAGLLAARRRGATAFEQVFKPQFVPPQCDPATLPDCARTAPTG